MRKILLLITLIAFNTFLYGCQGKLDVDQLTTASAIGIDKSEAGVKVTVQAINSSSMVKEGAGRTSIVTYSKEGKTIYQAFRKLMGYFPSRIFKSHFLLLAFGEEIAKEGIQQYIMYFYTAPETRQKYNIVVVKGGTAEDLLKIQTPFNRNPANEVNQSIEADQDLYGVSSLVYVDTLLANTLCPWSGTILTGVVIEGDPKKGSENKNVENADLPTKIKIDSLSVLKHDKLIGWINADEARGTNFIKDNIKSTIISSEYKDEDVLLELHKAKTTMKLVIKDNIPHISIYTKMNGVVNQLKTGKSFLSIEQSKELEKIFSDNVKEKMESAIKQAQVTYNADFFNISSFIHRKNKNYWNSIKDNYDEIFPKIVFEVNVQTKLLGTSI